jgi:methyl-accepting chemotaxis protein
MGWLNRLGNAIKGGAQRLGNKVHEGVDAGIRLMDKVAPVVDKVAGKVSSVAGRIGSVAGMAVPFTAEIPIVGEAVAGVAAGAKAVQAAAAGAKRGAQFIERASSTAKKIERDVDRAVQMGKDFAANPNVHDALRYKSEVSSMVRANKKNIQEARQQFGRIRKP